MHLHLYKNIEVNGKEFLIVHAGLGKFKVDKPLKQYNIHDLVWERHNFNKQYYKNKIIIVGHTPTELIKENKRPSYIYKNKNNIAIDCGCIFGRRLGCIRLEDLKEFYVEC